MQLVRTVQEAPLPEKVDDSHCKRDSQHSALLQIDTLHCQRKEMGHKGEQRDTKENKGTQRRTKVQ